MLRGLTRSRRFIGAILLLLLLPAPAASADPSTTTQTTTAEPKAPTNSATGLDYDVSVTVDVSPSLPPKKSPMGTEQVTSPSLTDVCAGRQILDDASSMRTHAYLWAGRQPGDGHVVMKWCPQLSSQTIFAFESNADPAAAPPPDPAVLAQQAIDTIRFPIPSPVLGPEEQLAVNRWIYLSVPNPGELTAQAAVPGLSISATATLTSTTWSMGETTTAGGRSRVPTFTCTGAGTAPSETANLRASEPKEPGSCAYVYKLRSLPERTAGSGTWPVVVTTTWSITWAATDGATGTATRTQTSAPLEASIGEWASELVPG